MPSIENTTGGTERYFGDRLEWCVSGGSLGVHDLKWAWSLEPDLETVNISASVSDQPCLDCGCAESNYYSSSVVQEYLRNRTVGGARGVAFSVLGYKVSRGRFAKNWQCSGVPTNFLSFVIINKVMSGDDKTELTFNVTSFTGDSIEESYLIHASTCFGVYIVLCYNSLVLRTVSNAPSHTKNRSKDKALCVYACVSVCVYVCVCAHVCVCVCVHVCVCEGEREWERKRGLSVHFSILSMKAPPSPSRHLPPLVTTSLPLLYQLSPSSLLSYFW